MRLRAYPLYCAALLFIGCQSDNGGQSGDFSGNDGQEGTDGNGCKDVETPIDAGDDSILGFSGSDATPLLEQGFTAPLTWRTLPNVSYAPGAGSSELTIAATATGEVWYVTSEPDNDDGTDIAVFCPPPRLRIGADVQVSSADGALSESLAAKVDASSPTLAQLAHHFDLAEIAGSLLVESLPAGGEVLGLALEATLSPAGMTGSLSSLLQVTSAADDPSEGAVSASPLLFASFPDSAACPGDQSGVSGIPVGIDDEALGLSGAAALDLYNGATPVAVSWQDGSESELTLSATASGGGCVQPNLYAYTADDAEAVVSYAVTLHATSDDGSLDGTYAAKLTTSPQRGSDDHRVVIEVSLPLELGDLAETGLEGLSLPQGLHRLSYTVSSEVEDGVAHGALTLNGLTDPPCVTDPPEPDPSGMSSAGCEGTRVTKLAGATWGRGIVD